MNEDGEVTGQATRGECHGGSMLLHPVVHLQLFNAAGEIYLQRRPEWKDIQPGMWDTAVGGHVDYGESIDEALRRECREELGIEDFEPLFLGRYIFRSSVKREFVHTYYTIYEGEIRPSEELDGGAFWSREQIDEAIEQGGVLTENFIEEYTSHLKSLEICGRQE